jgi:formylglycine-generating enzyme required for sulfatase activity
MLKSKPISAGVSPNTYLILLPLLIVCTACLDEASSETNSDTEAVRAQLVEIPGGAMTEGFAKGRLRKRVEVPSFSIMKHPTTRGDYQSCVDAGVCDALGESVCARSAIESFGPYELDADNAPLTCVPVHQAQQYCKWINGRLPTLSEWQFAVRGPAPRRYPWGSENASCERHPRAITSPEGMQGIRSTLPCLFSTGNRSLVVAEHLAGASEYGVEDVLITPGELLSTDAKSHVPACNNGFKACVVYGLRPGAIDAAMPVLSTSDPERSSLSKVLTVFGFRCVVED